MNPLRLPSTRQLRYFTALSETEHFGRAADACGVSQSAFSAAIQDLEEVLGLSLVDRTHRRVTITRAGKDIAVRARRALDELESMAVFARGASAPLTGPLHLGVIPTIAPFLLPAALPLARRKHPQLKLYLHEDRTARIHERLLDGRLDLVLLALPFDLPGTEVLPLFADPFRLAARADSTLLDPDAYRFDELPEQSVLLLEDGHCLRDHAMAACRVRNLEKVSRFGASSLLTLIEMVDADLGVTFLPQMAEGSALLRNTDVKTWPIGEGANREIALAWRKGSARGEEFAMLGELLREVHEAQG